MSVPPSVERRSHPEDPQGFLYGRRSTDEQELRIRHIKPLIQERSRTITAEMRETALHRSIGGNGTVSYLKQRELLAKHLSNMFLLHTLQIERGLVSVIHVGALPTGLLRSYQTGFYNDPLRHITDTEAANHRPEAEFLTAAYSAQYDCPQLGFAANLSDQTVAEGDQLGKLIRDTASDYVTYGVQTLSRIVLENTLLQQKTD